MNSFVIYFTTYLKKNTFCNIFVIFSKRINKILRYPHKPVFLSLTVSSPQEKSYKYEYSVKHVRNILNYFEIHKIDFSILVLTKKNCLHGLSAVTESAVLSRPVVPLHSEPPGTGQSSKTLQLRSSIHCTAHRPYDARKTDLWC